MQSDENLLFNQVRDELNATALDRGVAVLGASIVESALRSLLLHTLVPQNDVTSYINGATLATLRKLAFGIGLIPEDLYNDLKAIGEIRNALAHNYENRSFDEPSMASVIGRLVAPARFGKLHGNPVQVTSDKTAVTIRDLPRRFQFITCIAASATTLQHIEDETTAIQRSERFYVSPRGRT